MSKNSKHTKTNVVRLLETAHIPFATHEYEYDENDLAAQHVADALGQDINRVFKTLVLRGERTGLFVCVVPGNSEVNLKKRRPRRRQEGRNDSYERASAVSPAIYAAAARR